MPTDAETLLIELVRRTSPSTHEAGAVAYLVEWMHARSFDAYVDEVGNACGMRGPEDAPHTLALLGHIDTVPGEIPVRVEDGWLHGRGSVDAKGSLCAFAAAAAEAALPPGWRVVVIGAVEEEIATSRGAYAIRERFAPDACIIGEPSGADRITLGYKGRLLVDVELTGSVIHTARPEPSVGARGAALWQAVQAWTAQINADRPRMFDRIDPNLRAFNTEAEPFQETARLTIGFRLPTHIPPEAVADAVRGMAEPEATLRFYSAERAYTGEKNNALVRGMLGAIRAGGGRPNFVLKSGTSDMNVVGAAWDCPIVAYGPGDSNLDHTPQERIALAEYRAAVATLRQLIEHGLAGFTAHARTSDPAHAVPRR